MRDRPRTIEGIRVSREEFLKAKPVRNAALQWEKNGKGISVKVPKKQTFLTKLFSSQNAKVRLDEQGAFIWNLCDGEHKMKDIAKKLSEQYNMRVLDAENALDLYFVHLSKNGLIGFILPNSTRERFHKTMNTANIRKSMKKA